MDEKDQEIIVSPEEAKAEEEAQAEVKDEELRTKLAEEMGIDPDDEAELLDKVVAREKANREKLSGAIKQKIKYRDLAKAKGTPEKKPEGDDPSKAGTPQEKLTPEEVDKRVEEKLAERDLDAMNLTDDLRKEVKDLAKLRGISVVEAAKDSYIQHRIEEAKKQEKIDAASPTRKNKGSYAPNVDPSQPLNPADYDLNTEEGRKAWNDAKAARAKYRQENSA